MVLPRLFSEEGYRTYVYDPPLPNHKWSDDFSAFSPYPEITVNRLKGKYNQVYIDDHSDAFADGGMDTSGVIRERLPLYSFFRILFPVLRSIYYDDGAFFLMKDSPKEFTMFLDNYAVLHYLPEMTAIGEAVGSYVFIGNDAPHNPVYLQAPEYLPVMNPTNTYNPLQNNIDYGRWEQMLYHVNYATIGRVGEWFNYLKEEGIYDNTRIVMVSDHGDRVASPAFKQFSQTGRPYTPYQALLLFKDFGARQEMDIDYQFMTNADAPLLAIEGVVSNPLNLFTNNNLFNMVKKDEVNVYTLNHRNTGRNTGNQFGFDLPNSYSVHDTIFEESNWTPLTEYM